MPLTRQEADAYVHGIEQVTRVWYAGKKRDRHLQPRHLHAYNAVKKLIAQLKKIAYPESSALPLQTGPAFDLDLARENEAESRTLDGDREDVAPAEETE